MCSKYTLTTCAISWSVSSLNQIYINCAFFPIDRIKCEAAYTIESTVLFFLSMEKSLLFLIRKKSLNCVLKHKLRELKKCSIHFLFGSAVRKCVNTPLDAYCLCQPTYGNERTYCSSLLLSTPCLSANKIKLNQIRLMQ